MTVFGCRRRKQQEVAENSLFFNKVTRNKRWVGHVARRGTNVNKHKVETKTLPSRINPSAWGHLNPSSYCDVGRLFYGVFKLWSKL